MDDVHADDGRMASSHWGVKMMKRGSTSSTSPPAAGVSQFRCTDKTPKSRGEQHVSAEASSKG